MAKLRRMQSDWDETVTKPDVPIGATSTDASSAREDVSQSVETRLLRSDMAPRFSNFVIRGPLTDIRRDGILPDRFANSAAGRVKSTARYTILCLDVRGDPKLQPNNIRHPRPIYDIHVVKFIASRSRVSETGAWLSETWQMVPGGHFSVTTPTCYFASQRSPRCASERSHIMGITEPPSKGIRGRPRGGRLSLPLARRAAKSLRGAPGPPPEAFGRVAPRRGRAPQRHPPS